MTDVAVTRIDALGVQLLETAQQAPSGLAAGTVHAGPGQHQTLMALAAGAVLADHDNPGDATLLVLRGRVRLTWDGGAVEAAPGDLVALPDARHSVQTIEPAVALLTVPRSG